MSRKLIHLCDVEGRNKWCITDPERVEKLLAHAPITSGDPLLDTAFKIALNHKKS